MRISNEKIWNEYMTDKKSIKVLCKAADYVDISKLHNFQGKLKILPEDNLKKLKKEIIDTGFGFAIHVWENDGNLWIIDGHQRISVCYRLKSEGYFIPPLPIVKVIANSYADAKRRVLQGVSQYGLLDQMGFSDFIKDVSFDMDDFVFPEFDLSFLNYASDIDVPDFKPATENEQGKLDIKNSDKKTRKLLCPECGHEFTD